MNCAAIDTTTYIGIDTGGRVCAVCVMDGYGKVLAHTKYKNAGETADKLAKVGATLPGTRKAQRIPLDGGNTNNVLCVSDRFKVV